MITTFSGKYMAAFRAKLVARGLTTEGKVRTRRQFKSLPKNNRRAYLTAYMRQWRYEKSLQGITV